MAKQQPERAPDITMREVGPVTLRTAHWPAPEGSDHLPLLFFNGIGANLELAIRLGDMFPDREIITFDVPGVGGSPVTRWPYRAWMLARWARELLDQFGIGSVDVMGVSWGGAMAQQYAFQYRNSVGKLILRHHSWHDHGARQDCVHIDDARSAPLHRSEFHAGQFRDALWR